MNFNLSKSLIRHTKASRVTVPDYKSMMKQYHQYPSRKGKILKPSWTKPLKFPIVHLLESSAYLWQEESNRSRVVVSIGIPLILPHVFLSLQKFSPPSCYCLIFRLCRHSYDPFVFTLPHKPANSIRSKNPGFQEGIPAST